MPGIFISYRREDSAAYAGRLYDHLASHFGTQNVFMDVDSIEPGMDFIEVLQKTVSSCDVLIAVIGKQWLTATSVDGRRLDHPEDLVRVEVATALSSNVRVIPALVAGAQMPASHDLPEALGPLARRNAVEISDVSFLPSLSRLMETLEKILQGQPAPASTLPLDTLASQQTPLPNPARLNRLVAPRLAESPLEKLPPWRIRLLLYRPYSFGGGVCRFLFFFDLVCLVTAAGTLAKGAFKDGGEWGALVFFLLVAYGLSSAAFLFDKRAVQKQILGY